MLRTVLAVLFSLIAAGAALAQGEKRLGSTDIAGTWRGQWMSQAGSVYAATLVLRAMPNGTIDGNFAWVLEKSSRPEDQGKIGKDGVEYVSGRANTTARTVNLSGTSKNDPYGVVYLDRYKMVISDDGLVMGGLSENQGDWKGQIVLFRVVNDTRGR